MVADIPDDYDADYVPHGGDVHLMYKIICLDFETGELQPDGSFRASTEYYRPLFRVMSCAFSEFVGDEIRSEYLVGEVEVGQRIAELVADSYQFIVHNYQFEKGVFLCRYPHLQPDLAFDTMRLAQVYDNGGDKSAFEVVVDESVVIEYGETPEVKKIPTAGLGLVKCALRILGETVSHKKEAHDWIKANVPGVKKGQEGMYLDRLPPDILRTYNVADTEITLRLYKFITDYFVTIGYDWSLDHQLYKSTADFVVGAKIRGVPINRPLALKNREIVAKEITEIEQRFLTAYAPQIAEVEEDRLQKWLSKVKTDKGREGRLRKYRAGDPKALKEVKFNPGSGAQLVHLFMIKMGMVPKFFTKKGAPSTKASLLGQWGEPGLMLQKRKKRMIVLKQIDALYAASSHCNRWYIDIKVAGTSTSRMAGGRH
jgi:hypothetical protein